MESYEFDETSEVCQDSGFEELGLARELCEACYHRGWTLPRPIQQEAIPPALKGQDVVGLAESSSGKTGAFVLPVLQYFLKHQHRFFALILTPTRGRAHQIYEVMALGSHLGVQCALLTGENDKLDRAVQYANESHMIIATPDRLVEHMECNKGLDLSGLRYLVIDGADEMLNMGAEVEGQLHRILNCIPRKRRTHLFSITLTRKVQQLLDTQLTDPFYAQTPSAFQLIDNVLHFYRTTTSDLKNVHLVHVLNHFANDSVVVLCNTDGQTIRLALLIRALGIPVAFIYRQMTERDKLSVLDDLQHKQKQILIARGSAISTLKHMPRFNVVVIYDAILNLSQYIRQIRQVSKGGTVAISLITDDTWLEYSLGERFRYYPVENKTILALQESTAEARRTARKANTLLPSFSEFLPLMSLTHAQYLDDRRLTVNYSLWNLMSQN